MRETKLDRQRDAQKDVHTEHCCARHGCKYGNDNCPVWTGKKKQSFDCEMCAEDPTTPLMKLHTAVVELTRDFPDEPAQWSPDTVPICLRDLCELKKLAAAVPHE